MDINFQTEEQKNKKRKPKQIFLP
jgi:hypothetical protein